MRRAARISALISDNLLADGEIRRESSFREGLFCCEDVYEKIGRSPVVVRFENKVMVSEWRPDATRLRQSEGSLRGGA